jgi:DDE family transposase
VLVEPFLASYRRPPKVIGLEVDDTEAPVHGEQAQARYDGYYGGSCFLPLPLYAGLAGRLIPTSRKAKRFTGAPMLAGWKRLVKRRRPAWPATLRLFRGDRHFASPEVRQWINAHADRSSVTGLTRKNVLKALARQVVDQATRAYARAGGKMTRFHSTRSQAQTWAHPRRVVSKLEGSNPGVNTRFVVTALEQARTQGLSQKIDGARGQAENKSKDHKLSLQSDRTSCHRFEANQCRLLWQSAASVLLDTWRRAVLRTTPWASATMETIQWRLRKLDARVQALTTRITISLPSSCPVAPVLRRSLTLLACVRLTEQARWARSKLQRLKDKTVRAGPRGRPEGRAPHGDHATGLSDATTSWCACFWAWMILWDGCFEVHLRHHRVFHGWFFRLMNNSG